MLYHSHIGHSAYGETLAKEVAPFGIRVLTVLPGGFSTNGWEKASIPSTAKFEDYRPFIDEFREVAKGIAAKQPGDPDKFAKLLVDVVLGEGMMLDEEGKIRPWPERLVAGSDAMMDAKKTVKSWEHTIEEYGDLARSTDKRLTDQP